MDFTGMTVADIEQLMSAAAQQRETLLANEEIVKQTLFSDTKADLGNLKAAIESLGTLLADETTVGSLRSIIGPTGATAGTDSLRALRKLETNANATALISFVITLAQRTIDDAAATRKIARQVLRLAKVMVGDTTSPDVGAA